VGVSGPGVVKAALESHRDASFDELADTIKKTSFKITRMGQLVGMDMIALPGDTSAATIAAIIADEMAIGMVNNKTTAVRVIPVPGKKAGDWAEFGGLLGGAPIMAVNSAGSNAFINRGGRIPAPIHSFRN
jgi:uncharacterized protein (UPF0210 family)